MPINETQFEALSKAILKLEDSLEDVKIEYQLLKNKSDDSLKQVIVTALFNLFKRTQSQLNTHNWILENSRRNLDYINDWGDGPYQRADAETEERNIKAYSESVKRSEQKNTFIAQSFLKKISYFYPGHPFTYDPISEVLSAGHFYNDNITFKDFSSLLTKKHYTPTKSNFFDTAFESKGQATSEKPFLAAKGRFADSFFSPVPEVISITPFEKKFRNQFASIWESDSISRDKESWCLKIKSYATSSTFREVVKLLNELKSEGILKEDYLVPDKKSAIHDFFNIVIKIPLSYFVNPKMFEEQILEQDSYLSYNKQK